MVQLSEKIKKEREMKQKFISENRYSRRQKILMWFVFIGIFICGMMAGAFLWQKKTIYTADSKLSNAKKIEMFVERNTMPCSVKEKTLQQRLTENDHWQNVRVYEKLAQIGCEENKEKFTNFAQSERELADAMNYVNDYFVDEINTDNMHPCETIEKTLLSNIKDCGVGYTSYCHLRNAEVYSKMAEDGCPENKDVNTRKALDELQIAEGVRVNEEDVERDEIRSAINTYKKLQMQNEAKKYLNKVEKMIDPGIDFIMELQRVIEE